MYITLSQAKKQLQIDEDFNDDDNYIISLIQVAEDAIAKHLDIPLQGILVGGTLPPTIIQSILLLVANLYANREPVAYSSAVKVPYTIEYLVDLYRRQYCP